MLQTIMAAYEQGRLRPLQPLNLRENETVQIQLLSIQSEVDVALMALVKEGLVKLTSQ
ncbi:MAG: antitoxin family protein, partial [Anaerolineales bacterium]